MGRVHEPWGNVIEPLLLQDYCTYNYTNLNEIVHNYYQLVMSVSKFFHVV